MTGLAALFSHHKTGWVLFFGGILLAWLALYGMTQTSQQHHGAGFLTVLLMWLAMSAAMMAPTLVPSLTVYSDLTRNQAKKTQGFAMLITGYWLVWAGFSVLAALLQVWLASRGWLSGGRLNIDWVNAGLLIGAGLYQFSALKNACLSKCRLPLTFFMANWGAGPLLMGLRMGLYCLGCCWALMLLGFVGGTMDLRWMGVATLLMVIEKLPQIGRYVTRPLGGIMITAGALIALI